MGWSVDDVMPGRDGPENLRILKRVSWSWDWTMESNTWGLGHWVEELSFSDLNRQRWIEILNTTRCPERWGGVSIVWLRKTFKNCVSLLVSKNQRQEVNKPVRIWNKRVRQCFAFVVDCIWICICSTVVIDIIMVMVCNNVNEGITLTNGPENRKLMTVQEDLHPWDDTYRLYESRKEGGRGLIGIEDSVDVLIQRLELYIKKQNLTRENVDVAKKRKP